MDKLRADFKTLDQTVNNHRLVYLDSAATTHKPTFVLDTMRIYNEKYNANPRRGAYYLGVQATEFYENARTQVANFINAQSTEEIIFTKNATEALNLVACSYGLAKIEAGDEIVLCISEHHSNIVPWQRIAKEKQAQLKYLYLNSDYTLDMVEVERKITKKTKLVGIAQMSNVLGTIYPVKEITTYAHAQGAVVLVDAAQSVPHMTVDVQDLDADFLVFSGHKMLGPMGIGVLYGKKHLLEELPPFLLGGDMIEYVEEQTTTFAELPYKFEAGTPNVEGAIGLGTAIEYLEQVGLDKIFNHEQKLTEYALAEMTKIPYISVVGPQDLTQRGSVISFTVDGCHPHDIASIVDQYGVALRAGHHCAQPLMKYLQVPATSRISFYLYNNQEDIDIFIDSIKQVRKWLGYGS